MIARSSQRGFTLVELTVSIAMGALILGAISAVTRSLLHSQRVIQERNELTQQARFAMERIVSAVSNSELLLLPLADRPSTNWRENVREQTMPASPPEGDSTNATAVLAVTLPTYSDMDFDGFPDVDNDRDGRFDEDPDGDRNNDFEAGIYLIDDDGDGRVDEGFSDADDDEDGAWNEDFLNGLDDDADNSLDEDPDDDRSADGCPGVCGVDDDGDGSTDEGSEDDDDEDGTEDEDWYDALVFYLDNGTLKERLPVPWDVTGIGGVTGRDFLISDLADNVTLLRFERLPRASFYDLVDIRIELTGPGSETVSLSTRVRVGGAL